MTALRDLVLQAHETLSFRALATIEDLDNRFSAIVSDVCTLHARLEKLEAENAKLRAKAKPKRCKRRVTKPRKSKPAPGPRVERHG